MQCYCKKLTGELFFFWKIIGLNFLKFDINKKDDTNYCALFYAQNLLSTMFAFFEKVFVVTLNAIIAKIFGKVVEFLKLRYKTEEQLSGFN